MKGDGGMRIVFVWRVSGENIRNFQLGRCIDKERDTFWAGRAVLG